MRQWGTAIARTWDGAPVGADELARVRLRIEADALHVNVLAPFHGDPPPPDLRGRQPGLWNHEVVEIFLLGDDDRYLEIELGPHGHYLVLTLHGRRQPLRDDHAIEYEAEIDGGQWHGHARVDAGLLPPGLSRFNAYAIHGVGAARRFLAAHPVPGAAPDFHRLDRFGALPVEEAEPEPR